MSSSGAQAAAFFRDVARTGQVWAVEDNRGSPVQQSESGGPVIVTGWDFTVDEVLRTAAG